MTKSKTKNSVVKPVGKIEFVRLLLLAKGKSRVTLQEAADKLRHKFPTVTAKTAGNTVKWVAYIGLPRQNKKSNHLPSK